MHTPLGDSYGVGVICDLNMSECAAVLLLEYSQALGSCCVAGVNHHASTGAQQGPCGFHDHVLVKTCAEVDGIGCHSCWVCGVAGVF